MSKEYIDVLPTNVNQVQAVSYHDGNPLVEFCKMSQKCPIVTVVTGFGQTIQYNNKTPSASRLVSKVWLKHVTTGTLGQNWDILQVTS